MYLCIISEHSWQINHLWIFESLNLAWNRSLPLSQSLSLSCLCRQLAQNLSGTDVSRQVACSVAKGHRVQQPCDLSEIWGTSRNKIKYLIECLIALYDIDSMHACYLRTSHTYYMYIYKNMHVQQHDIDNTFYITIILITAQKSSLSINYNYFHCAHISRFAPSPSYDCSYLNLLVIINK